MAASSRSGKMTRIVFVACVSIAAACTYIIYVLSVRNESYKQLVAVVSSVEIGDHRASVIDIATKMTRITLSQPGQELIVLSTPVEFGAANWICVFYVPDGHVRAIGLRQSDNIAYKVSPFAADRISPEWEDQWSEINANKFHVGTENGLGSLSHEREP